MPSANKLVSFDLPYLIMVNDNLKDHDLEEWLRAYQENRELPLSRYAPTGADYTIIGAALPVHIPQDPIAPDYNVLCRGEPALLRFIRRVNNKRSTILFGEMPGDRTGKASYSTVECWFSAESVSDGTLNEMRPYVDFAIDTINHFLRHYRIIAQRTWILNITPELVQEFNLATVQEDKSMLWQTYSTGGGPLNGFGGAIAGDVDVQIRQAIMKSDPPDIRAELDANVKDLVDLRRYREAIIETAILFESFLSHFITEAMRLRGASLADMKSVLFRDGDEERPHEAMYLAKAVVRQKTGFAFGETSEYKTWVSDLHKVRNNLVHGRSTLATRQMAEAAYAAARKAKNILLRHATPGQ